MSGMGVRIFLGNYHISSKVDTTGQLKAELLANRISDTSFVLLVIEKKSVRDTAIKSESKIYWTYWLIFSV